MSRDAGGITDKPRKGAGEVRLTSFASSVDDPPGTDPADGADSRGAGGTTTTSGACDTSFGPASGA
jgi:hypothetical protein